MDLGYEGLVCVLFFCGFLLILSAGYGIWTAVLQGVEWLKRKWEID